MISTRPEGSAPASLAGGVGHDAVGPIPASSLTQLTRVQTGDGPLLADYHVSDTGALLLAAQWWDPEYQAACRATDTSSGWWCIPDSVPTKAGEFYQFADPDCTLGMWFTKPEAEPAAVLLQQESDECGVATLAAFEAEPYEGIQYVRNQRGGCEPDDDPVRTGYVRGAILSLEETFESLSLQTD